MAITTRGNMTRLMIVDAGTRLYLQKGFTDTTNMQICKMLNISTGQFTFHFPTKEHLLKELVEELCAFQYELMARIVDEGNTSLMAMCLEFATIVAVCEKYPGVKDFYLASYSHPMTLEVLRDSDARRAKEIYSEYCKDWTDEDYVKMQMVVSGIEYGTLMTTDEHLSMEERIRAALECIMKLYHVPEEVRQKKLQKLFRLDYASIGEQTLAEFKQYIKRVNEKALEETVRQNKGNIHG